MAEFTAKDIRRNKKIFLNYNQLRQRCAYDLKPEKASVAFEIIPVLLSLNEPDIPGYIPKGENACGVYGIGSSKHLKSIINRYFPATHNKRISYQRHIIKRPIIESLLLMGSIGTIAQNDKSDFDFWVCTDPKFSSDAIVRKLQNKTDRISRFCQASFNMEVHFFIMRIDDIRNNDFGLVDEESSGSSQRIFLKEEFYRTLLLVSGKIPFWWAVPAETSHEDYEKYWDAWVKKNTFDSDDFIDLGCIGAIPRKEFLGTTLWHLSKGIKDPFKALIKMAMMERYLSDNFSGPMLCEIIKKRVLDGPTSLRNTDPYLLMFESIFEFYRQTKRWDRMELLRKAFYIKADPQVTRLKLINRNCNYQIEVFKELLHSWDWSLDLCEELNQIENWSYVRHLKFSTKINKFFFTTYKYLREVLADSETQSINNHDLTLLGRKLFALFAKQKNKLQLTPFLKKEGLTLEKCIFKFSRSHSVNKNWYLFDATRYLFERQYNHSTITSSRRVARTAAWLVINGLYDLHKTKVEMLPNPSGLNVNDLIDLLKHIQLFFPPALHRVKLGTNMEKEARINQIMIVIDLEKDDDTTNSASTDLIYNNTWGEMFTETYPLKKALSVVREALNGDDPGNIDSKVRIHIPKSAQIDYSKSELYYEIMPNKN